MNCSLSGGVPANIANLRKKSLMKVKDLGVLKQLFYQNGFLFILILSFKMSLLLSLFHQNRLILYIDLQSQFRTIFLVLLLY